MSNGKKRPKKGWLRKVRKGDLDCLTLCLGNIVAEAVVTGDEYFVDLIRAAIQNPDECLIPRYDVDGKLAGLAFKMPEVKK